MVVQYKYGRTYSNNFGRTLLLLAFSLGNFEISKLLVECEMVNKEAVDGVETELSYYYPIRLTVW